MKVKTTPDNDNKNNIQESIEKLNKNIETLIEQKEKEKSKTNSGDKTVSSSSYEEKLQKLQDKKEDKYREENRKLRDSLFDSFVPRDIRNPGINALAGGLLGIDPAVMQAFGVDKAVGSLFDNLRSKRRTNQDIKIESQRLNRRYESVDKTTKKQYGSVIQEDEDTKYAKHFNELNKTLKEGFSSKKEQAEEKKEKSNFFSKILGFLSGPMMKLIGGLVLGMLAIRGINLVLNKLYDGLANSWLGRQLGLDKRNGDGTGRDEDGKKNNLSDTDKFLDEGLGISAGLKTGGLSLINKGNAAKTYLSLNKPLEGLTPQQRVATVAKDSRFALSAETMKKAGLYENKGTFGWLNKAANNTKPGVLNKVSSWTAKQGLKAYPTVTKTAGWLTKGAGKIIGKAATPLAIGLGALEAGSAFAKGDNRGGYGAIAGTAGGIGGALAGAALGQLAIPIPVVGALIGGIAGALGGDLLGRKTSNAIYDANHPEQESLNLDTDKYLSQSKSLEETQRALEQMKLTNDFQRTSIESLENIEKILKESQYQDKAYYSEDLQKSLFSVPSSKEDYPHSDMSTTMKISEISDRIFHVTK